MMQLNNYKVRNVEIDEKKEYEYYQIFLRLSQSYGFHYMFFTLEEVEKNKRVVFSTDPGWQKCFINDRLIDDCPLYSAARIALGNKKSHGGVILPWDSVPITNNKQSMIMGMRAEHGIQTGLSIAIKNKHFRAILGLGADYHNRDFIRLISDNSSPLRKGLQESIKILS